MIRFTVAIIALVGCAELAFTTETSVYVVDSLRKIKRDDAVPAVTANRATLAAAGNEYEAFQIIVNGNQTGWKSVNAQMAGALAGPQGATIPVGNVAFYREHYVRIVRPSNSGEGGAQPGTYPDA